LAANVLGNFFQSLLNIFLIISFSSAVSLPVYSAKEGFPASSGLRGGISHTPLDLISVNFLKPFASKIRERTPIPSIVLN
jgi:hypothetical protein